MTSAPVDLLKAEFFRALGHPVRIRLLELLSEGEQPVTALLSGLGVEHTYLSQQLAVLRRLGPVSTRRTGSTVHCSLGSPQPAELLAVARVILGELPAEQTAMPADLKASPPRPPTPG